MRKGVALGFFGIGPAYRPESLANFARMTVQLSSIGKQIYNTAIDGLITSGWWNDLDLIYITNLATEQQGILNLKGNYNNLINVNALFWTPKVGYLNTMDVSRYLHSNWIENVGGPWKFGEEGRRLTFLNVFQDMAIPASSYWMERSGQSYWMWRIRQSSSFRGGAYAQNNTAFDIAGVAGQNSSVGFNALIRNSDGADVKFITQSTIYRQGVTQTPSNGLLGNTRIEFLRRLGTNANWIGIGKSRGSGLSDYADLIQIIQTFNSQVVNI